MTHARFHLVLPLMACALVLSCAPRQHTSRGTASVKKIVAELNGSPGPETAHIEHVAKHRWDALTVNEFRLGNGLKVLLAEDHSAPVFAYQTWFNVGSSNERPGITGIAHLFEHLMFKQTSTMGDGEFDQLLEGLGGRINASTWLDWTYYRDSLPTGNMDLVARLEADRMRNLVLNEAQVNSERGVVENERRFRIDNSPMGTLYENLYSIAFREHPYRWPTVGWMKDLEAITLDDCLDFYQTYYAPNDATVVIVGDFDTRDALASIRKYYGKMDAQKIPEEHLKPEPAQKAERRKEMELALGVEKLLVGYRQPSANSPDHAAIEVINAILFDGESSRVHERLVTEEELASEVSGWVSPFQHEGIFEIVVSMKPGLTTEKAEKLLYEELKGIGAKGVTARELDKAKNRLETQFRKDLQTSEDRARILGDYATTHGDYTQAFHAVDRYRSVTAADVQRVAKSLFAPEHRTVVIAHPKKKEGEALQ